MDRGNPNPRGRFTSADFKLRCQRNNANGCSCQRIGTSADIMSLIGRCLTSETTEFFLPNTINLLTCRARSAATTICGSSAIACKFSVSRRETAFVQEATKARKLVRVERFNAALRQILHSRNSRKRENIGSTKISGIKNAMCRSRVQNAP